MTSKSTNKLEERGSSHESDHRLHFQMIRYIFEAGIKLSMNSVPLATAATIYHRFFRDFSTIDFDPHMVATTSLFIAGKIEEEHVRLTDVVNVCYRILHPDMPPLDIGATYWTLRDSVIQCELYIMRALNFQVSFEHPHKYLLHHLKALYDWLDDSVTDRIPVAHTAWALLRDSYHSNVCLNYRPDLVAVSVLYLALKSHGVDIPYDNEAQTRWWEALVDGIRLRDIRKVVSELFDMYNFETTLTA